MKSIKVNGINIYPFISEDQLLSYIEKTLGILIAVNSKKIKGANEALRKLINNNIGYVDGAGAQIALKHKGIQNPIKIPGCELWLKIINKFHQNKSIYLVGGSQEVIEATVNKLKSEFPAIRIIGFRNGYMTKAEEEELIEEIQIKKPGIVFVAMGSPKQEYLMEKLNSVHPAIYQGLGGSFDVYVGKVKRAPKWIADHNIEGIYRAIFEPKKRLKGVLTDIKFLYDIKKGKY